MFWRLTCIPTFIVLLLVVGCVASKGDVQQFVPYEEGHTYILDPPMGYKQLFVSGDHERRHEYWYRDSMVLYVSTFMNPMNYEELRASGKYYEWFEAFMNGDTLLLAGHSSTGLFWQDRLLGNKVHIGFRNIPAAELEKFKAAAFSFRQLK